MNRIARLAAVAVLGAGLAVAAPASPAAAAACPDARGVTVVVDFAGLGGGVAVRCAPGDPATGLAALTGAGFGYAFVPRQPGLVCQIDGLPNPCNGAPQDAYWSYWHAERGGSWQFSSRGAGSFDPTPGTVEGWAFGAADPPGVPPPAPPAPPPPADDDPPDDDPPDRDPPGDEPGDADSPAGGGDVPADRDPSAGGDERPQDRSPAGGPSAGGSSGPPSPGATGPTPTGGGTAAPALPGDPAARTTDEPGGAGGGLAGLVVTATLVGALAAVGIWTARRRRHGTPATPGGGDEPAGGAAADG
ncbi:MAG: hypothetical protein GEV12_03330 [Micromonosporaceae bacterium]|nr:hypothetical protein [Micromonosporaceae bacterium]